MQDQRVLVTGGAGFIGSNLANSLAEANQVTVVDDGYLGTPENLHDDVEYVEASVTDDDLPTDVDALFHLAALSSYAMHEEDPARGARVNVEGFVNTVEQARRDGCETVVYATTSSIYGNRTEPSPETMAVEANTGYEASKIVFASPALVPGYGSVLLPSFASVVASPPLSLPSRLAPSTLLTHPSPLICLPRTLSLILLSEPTTVGLSS